ncbi:hypothetical protein OG226_25325 [Streptomyces sp. NBC_01261]|uniref:hypothetical protein n=1 Tax=Streptomyces sp. NBC_01261 TaxID=2903802 RepID=UPI002E2F048F|nr:hypothetical protein [Streptomyces sp. NBC_01261]
MGHVRSNDEGWRVMGRRTAWWRTTRAQGGRTPVAGAVRRVVVLAAVLCATAALTDRPAMAAGSSSSYGYDKGDRVVDGATGIADAEDLKPGGTYRSSLSKGAGVYYGLDLDATSNAYVSVTAVPPAGTTVAATDGIKVSMRNAKGSGCTYRSATFGAGRSPHPVTAWAVREAGKALCKGSGKYYVLVERVDASDSSSDTWGLELTAVSEPALAQAGATDAPQVWDSASPEAVTGEARRRAGGSGFAGAVAVGQGAWRDDIGPGRTLFYKVPVDWGQQLSVTAELGASDGGSGYVNRALDLALYNPVRASVDQAGLGYRGSERSVALEPLPPVEYRNRYSVVDHENGMRFAGSYYLVVHLDAQLADDFGQGPFPVTLRVRVAGTAHGGPGYAGRPEPRSIFDVTAQDQAAAVTGSAGGSGGGGGGGDSAMKVLAVAGIGAGTVLLATLGVWTVSARRRERDRVSTAAL